MNNNIETLQRYLTARYYTLEVVSKPVKSRLSFLAEVEFKKVSRDLRLQGIEYVEMGSPKRATLYSL